MANLVKIKKIALYTALTEDAAECYNAMKLLKDNNVPFSHLNWRDGDEIHNVFTPLNTWNFSDNGEDTHQKVFTKMPIVHWECVYDNDNVLVNAAQGYDELVNSQLMANLDKIVVPIS